MLVFPQLISRFLAVALIGFALAACSPHPTGSPNAGEKSTITIGAASDLQSAFTEIGPLFETETGHRAVFTFGSTGNLAKQIENGAPIDVFAAANVQFVDDLRAKGLIVEDSQRLYAVGRLALAVNKNARVEVRRLEDLARPGVKRIAIANPTHAPYGVAAREALENVGLWEAALPRLVIGENISQALQFVKTGNAEVGLIALSLANAPEITYTLIPEDSHSRLNQAMAVVKPSKNREAARQFVAFVGSPEARAILEKYGFEVSGEQ